MIAYVDYWNIGLQIGLTQNYIHVHVCLQTTEWLFGCPEWYFPLGLFCLWFTFLLALCSAISPRCLGGSPWNFYKWLEVWALRHCLSQIWGLPKEQFWEQMV